MADATPLRDVGGLITDGCMGAHSVRLLAWPDEARHLAVVVDGEHRQARTLRGVARIVAEMIFKRANYEGGAAGGRPIKEREGGE